MGCWLIAAMQCKGSLQKKMCDTGGMSELEFVNQKNGNIVVDFNLLFTSNKYRLFTLASAFWPLWPLRQAVFCLDQPLGLWPLVWSKQNTACLLRPREETVSGPPRLFPGQKMPLPMKTACIYQSVSKTEKSLICIFFSVYSMHDKLLHWEALISALVSNIGNTLRRNFNIFQKDFDKILDKLKLSSK